MRRHPLKRLALAAGLTLALAAATASPVLADPLAQTPAAGAVVGLSGTPHLWIADAQGVLHWAGDTRALAGKNVQWNNRRDVSLAQLNTMQRGDPWLSAGLVKSGDPIFLPKWEGTQTAPTLLRVQSIQDLTIFGINGTNYGALVLDQPAWERVYPFAFSSLTQSTLPKATTPILVTLHIGHSQQNVTLSPDQVDTVHEVGITGAAAGVRLMVSGTYEIGGTAFHSFGPELAGVTDAQGMLTWRRTHPSYSAALYTFTDPAGNSISIAFKVDVRSGS